MRNPHNLQVGQELWYVPNNLRLNNQEHVKILKLGRVWATMERGPRANMETLRADGDGWNSQGRFWLSEDDHKRWKETARLWESFRREMPWACNCSPGWRFSGCGVGLDVSQGMDGSTVPIPPERR